MIRQMQPRTIRWTREEFDRMGELGLFIERNVELIDGEIVEMPNQGPSHYVAIDNTAEQLAKAFGPAFWVRQQAPLALSVDGEPNPDVSVVRGKRAHYVDHHPTIALLVMEASESTLAYDRGKKGSGYARAKVPEYWIINLINRQLEVRRKPVKNNRAPLGYAYKDLKILGPDDYATIAALPGVRIKVADLLP